MFREKSLAYRSGPMRLALLTTSAFVLPLTACTSTPYYAGVPAYGGVGVYPYPWGFGGGYYFLEAPGQTDQEEIGAVEQALGGPTDCAASDSLCRLQAGAINVNAYLKVTLSNAEELGKGTATESNNTGVYGPKDLPIPGTTTPVATFKLSVKRMDSDNFSWKLESKPIGGPDSAYQTVLTGTMKKGSSDKYGRGTIGVDLDALAQVNSTVFTGQGKLIGAFENNTTSNATAFRLQNFKASPQSRLVPNGILVAHVTADGKSRVRFDSHGEEILPPRGGGDLGAEDLLVRGNWTKGTGGRSAIVISGGDVPSYGAGVAYVLQVACFDSARAKLYSDLFSCTSTPTCTRVTNPPSGFASGNSSACLANTELYSDTGPPPATDLSSPDPEPGAPFNPGTPGTTLPPF